MSLDFWVDGWMCGDFLKSTQNTHILHKNKTPNFQNPTSLLYPTTHLWLQPTSWLRCVTKNKGKSHRKSDSYTYLHT